MLTEELFKFSRVGNGAIIIWENKFVFAVGKEAYWEKSREPWRITYTNVGGWVEPNERLIESIKREVLEETGCKAELLPASKTLYCDFDKRLFSQYSLDDECPPLLVYNMESENLSAPIYLAKISDPPYPNAEVPALLLLPPQCINGGILTELLKNDGRIIEQIEGLIPRHADLRPWGSAELLATDYDWFNFGAFLAK